LGLEFGEGVVAAVARVDIEDDDTGDLTGGDSHVTLRVTGPPPFDLFDISRCVLNAVWGLRMFARGVAVGLAACTTLVWRLD
jgi:hypothetical protein